MIVFCVLPGRNITLLIGDRNDLSKQTVWDFLECNEAVLQEYVQKNISEETVMKWLDDKSSVQSEVPLARLRNEITL